MIAAVVVGGVAIRGGAGTVLGMALGALTLLVIRNGLTLVRVDPLWLQGVYGLVILVAIGIDAFVVRRAAQARLARAMIDDVPALDRLLGHCCCGRLALAVFALRGDLAVPNFVSAFNLSQAAAGVVGKGAAGPADGAADHRPRDRPVDRLHPGADQRGLRRAGPGRGATLLAIPLALVAGGAAGAFNG